MTRTRTLLLAPALVLLHAFAREADRGLGLVLRSEVAPDGLLAEVGRAVAADGLAVTLRLALWLVGGLAAWVALAGSRRRTDGGAWRDVLSVEAWVLSPLLLRPAMTLVALVSVAIRSSYPYGFTLPVALTQDWAIGQDAAALAALVALRARPRHLPAPSAGGVFLVAFLAYAMLAPDWALRWEGHPGNEPKYLRQGAALALGLTFDAEGVSAAMEELPARPLGAAIKGAAATVARESGRMAGAILRGEVGREAIGATRITRQTVRGKEGGVYYVLAPGPSLTLAPTLRIDRAINRARGTPGRLAVTVLASCALAALLLAALFLLVRDATSRPGLAAALAFGFAVLPPFLFYFFQFYPEMPGALLLAVAFRTLALGSERLVRHPWRHGWLLAVLPWLHQKFLPVWAVLVVTAVLVGRLRARDAAPRPVRSSRWAVGLLVPQALTLVLTALYNFSITGSVRPDALFLAWGPGGVTGARVGQGLLGLVLDARYGILPYVPLFLLAAAGLVRGGAHRFAVVLPAAAVYYATVASADNWAGAVCNLGRYFMPVAPLAVALVGIALGGTPSRGSDGVAEARASGGDGHVPGRGLPGGLLVLAVILAAWSGLVAYALRQDPHAANDSALLLAKSLFADGNQYIPNLHIRRWADGAPGLAARLLAWLVVIGLVAVAFRRPSAAGPREPRPCPRSSPCAMLVAVTLVVLALAFALERWPSRRSGPSFVDSLPVGPEARVFFSGAVEVREDEAVAGPGSVALLVRAPLADTAAPSGPPALAPGGGKGDRGRLRALVGGTGVLRAPGLPPLLLRPAGALVDLDLSPYHVVRSRGGRAVRFLRTRLDVDGTMVFRLMPGQETEPLAPEIR